MGSCGTFKESLSRVSCTPVVKQIQVSFYKRNLKKLVRSHEQELFCGILNKNLKIPKLNSDYLQIINGDSQHPKYRKINFYNVNVCKGLAKAKNLFGFPKILLSNHPHHHYHHPLLHIRGTGRRGHKNLY